MACGNNPSIIIRKLVDLMKHPISENATDRHLKILQHFLNASNYAFILSDISFIIQLYEIIVKKLDKNPQFKKPLECLLIFSAFPPIMTKASDKVNYSRDLQEYFSLLGYLILCLHNNDLKKLVLNAIKGLLQTKPPRCWNCFTPLKTLKEAAELSRLPEVLAQLVEVVNDVIYPLLLEVMFLVCQISTPACEKMLVEKPIENLLQRLDPEWQNRRGEIKPKRPTIQDKVTSLEDTCCVLWKLLTAIDHDKMTIKEPSNAALWSVQYAFHWTTLSSVHKTNRNNIAAIILKLLETFPELHIHGSGIFDDLISLAVNIVSKMDCSNENSDFQFKKIVLFCLFFFSREAIYKSSRGVEVVKVFLKAMFQIEGKTKNHLEQQCALIKIILKILPKFLVVAEEVFIHFNGPIKIIDIIESYATRPFEAEILEAYTYCLNECLMTGFANTSFQVGEHKAVDVITRVMNKILEHETIRTEHQKVLAHGFCILQFLDTAGFNINAEVIKLCTSFLHRVVHPTATDILIDVRVTICAIFLLWECTLRSKPLYREFLKQGGIYVMLDITEASTLVVKSLCLGILADAAFKASCVPFLITWRKHGKNLIPMLLTIFRRKTERECDKKMELHEQEPKNAWVQLCQAKKTSFEGCIPKKEILEMSRIRIHAIFYAIKIKHKNRVKTANDFYKTFNAKLNADDELTMLFAENFESLRMCQTWLAVARELQSEGVEPTEEDRRIVEEKLDDIRQWKAYLQCEIQRIFFEDLGREKFNEMKVYTILKEARLSNALDALKELMYVAKGTERMFQMRRKIMIQNKLDLLSVKNAHFHDTVLNLDFLSIYNQNINIQSNIIYEKREECPVTTVSLEEEENVLSPSLEHVISEPKLTCKWRETHFL